MKKLKRKSKVSSWFKDQWESVFQEMAEEETLFELKNFGSRLTTTKLPAGPSAVDGIEDLARIMDQMTAGVPDVIVMNPHDYKVFAALQAEWKLHAEFHARLDLKGLERGRPYTGFERNWLFNKHFNKPNTPRRVAPIPFPEET